MTRTSYLLLLTVLVGASAACGGAAILGGGGSGAPTVSQRLELALGMEDETEAVASELTAAAPGVPPSFVVAACPTVNNNTDSDGDGIPNDQTRTYADPPCTTSIRGGVFAVTGTLRIQDSTPGDAFQYRLTATDLAWSATDPATTRTFTATRNGTRTRSRTDSSGVLTTAMTIVRQRPNRANTTVDLAGVAEFVSNGGGAPAIGQPLPPGRLRLTGSFRWRRSTEDWTIAVTTPTPLVYDPTCPATPQRITAGQLALTGTISGADGTLVLTFNGCGNDPTRAWVAAS